MGRKQVLKRNYDNEGNLISKECYCCHEVKPASEFSKDKGKKDGFCSKCKECRKQYSKQYYEDNVEAVRKRHKQYYEDNVEAVRKRQKQYYEDNIEAVRERQKQYSKQYYEDNAEAVRERHKQYNTRQIQETLQQIKTEVESDPEKYNHIEGKEIYGIIYLVHNIKSDKYYVGQTTVGFNNRYPSGWLYTHNKKDTVKHDLELYGEDSFEYIKIFKVGYSQYELDKLEAYYINYYDSYENGYNENRGNIFTDRGKEK